VVLGEAERTLGRGRENFPVPVKFSDVHNSSRRGAMCAVVAHDLVGELEGKAVGGGCPGAVRRNDLKPADVGGGAP
jgi:hypothetical protein